MLHATKDVLFAGGASSSECVQTVRHAPNNLVDDETDEVIDVEVFPITPPATEIGRRVLLKSSRGGAQGREAVRDK